MTATQNMSKLDGSSHNLLWIVLLIGVAVHLPINIPGTNWVPGTGDAIGSIPLNLPFTIPETGFKLQLAAFDIFLPVILFWGWRLGWLTLPPRKLIICVSAGVAAILIHSIANMLLSEQLLFARLIKETLKLVSIIIQFILLVVIFGQADRKAPPFNVVLIILIICCTIFSALSIFIKISAYEPISWTRTIYATYLSGLIFLLVLNDQWQSQLRLKICLIVACLGVIATSVLLHSKSTAGLVTAILAWVILERYISLTKLPRISLVSAIFLTALGVGIAVSAFLGAHFEFIQHLDTVKRSIEIRLTLWNLAIYQIIESFPFGVGLGQFPLITKSIPILAQEGHTYVHNTFLGLAVELGLIGILIGAGIVWVLSIATLGLPLQTAPVYLMVVLPPLLFHDGHSIRILLLITALGLTRYIQNKKILS